LIPLLIIAPPSGVSQIVAAFGRGEGCKQAADAAPDAFDRALLGLAQESS